MTSIYEINYARNMHDFEKVQIVLKQRPRLPDNTSIKIRNERKKGSNKSYNIIFDYLLNATEPHTITQLAALLDMSNSKINWNLMRLLEAGLVRKTLIQFWQKNRSERKYVYYV